MELASSPKRAPHWLWRVAVFLLFASAWQLLATTMHSLLFPTFTDTLSALGTLLSGAALWKALWISNQAMLLGFAIAVIIGVPLGMLMGRNALIEKLSNPYLDIMLATPKSAIIPIIIFGLGLGLVSRVVVIVLFAVVMIVVHTRASIQMVDADTLEMARAFGASERQLWMKVLLPGALPGVMAALRLGLGRAIGGMIAVELLLVALGLGRLLLDYQGAFKSDFVYAMVIVIVLESVLALHGLHWLERRLAPWAEGWRLE